MSRLILDLTELHHDAGPFTGIQRAVYGIAAAADDGAFTYCRFDAASNQLVAATLTDYADRRPQTVDRDPSQGTSIRSFARELAARYRRQMTAEQARTLRRIYDAGSDLGVAAKQAITRRWPDPRRHAPPADPIAVLSTDTLIVAGRLWDDPAYLEYIVAARERTAFRLAVIVYDLIPIYQRHITYVGLTDRYSDYLSRILAHADCLLPISVSCKEDLLRFAAEIGAAVRPSIHVLRQGSDPPRTVQSRRPGWLAESHNTFILCVGTVEARKNHVLLYMTYKLACERGVALPHLLIVGKPGWLTDDIVHFIRNDPEINQQITIQGYVTDAELEWLYAHALLTVYPSQYEGWGLPLAESLSHGVPCLASWSSSMPEIAPGLVDHLSPYDSGRFLDSLIAMSDQINNRRRRDEIAERYKPTTWAQTAREVVRILGSGAPVPA